MCQLVMFLCMDDTDFQLWIKKFNTKCFILQRLCEDLQYAYLLEKAASKHGMVFYMW